jgi:hypothetical protein
LHAGRAKQEIGEAAVSAWAEYQQLSVIRSREQCRHGVVFDGGLRDLDVPDLADDVANEIGEPFLALLRAAILLDPLRPRDRLPLRDGVHDVQLRPPPPRLLEGEAQCRFDSSEPSTPTTSISAGLSTDGGLTVLLFDGGTFE